MTQTATAPDGYGLIVWSEGQGFSRLWEDGIDILRDGGLVFGTMAQARKAAMERYLARVDAADGTGIVDHIRWTTHP